MIRVKNHHIPATILVEIALGKIKQMLSLKLSLPCSNSHYGGVLVRGQKVADKKFVGLNSPSIERSVSVTSELVSDEILLPHTDHWLRLRR